MTQEIITALITAGIPSLFTAVSAIVMNRTSRRHSAKQSILQMIMEDEFGWQAFKKPPINYGDIQDEYATYHKNGGNGEITRRVKDYQQWYDETLAEIAKNAKK